MVNFLLEEILGLSLTNLNTGVRSQSRVPLTHNHVGKPIPVMEYLIQLYWIKVKTILK